MSRGRIKGSKDLKPRKKRTPKQFCVNGHDTFIVGRSKNNGICKECDKVYAEIYKSSHKEKIKIDQKKWKEENREAYNAYHRKLYNTNLNHKLASRIRDRISSALKGKVKPASAVAMLGCSIDFLKQYIESLFLPEMSWDNWNKYGWHIDHITPLDSFDLTDPIQFKRAVHYTNLRPMWAEDNWFKGNRF